MPVLRHGGRLLPLEQPPHGNSPNENAKGGHGSHPHVDEARGEVVSEWAQRAPSLLVSAEGLLGEALSAEVAAAELGDNGAVAREGSRREHDLLLLRGQEAVAVTGEPHWRGHYTLETGHKNVISGGRWRKVTPRALVGSAGRCLFGRVAAAVGLTRLGAKMGRARCEVLR